MTGINKVCLVGGLALNCSSNGRLAQQKFVGDLYVQPISNDAGTSLGAAFYVQQSLKGEQISHRLDHLYWGPSYSDNDIKTFLETEKISTFKRLDGFMEVARFLNQQKIVGWFQGNLEVGPRALGNRSIFADARNIQMKDRLNVIKGRELWRPLAPSIMSEFLQEYVVGKIQNPNFMIVAYEATTKAKETIPAALHVDGTLRPQSVSPETNKSFWDLMNCFYKLTGVPGLINTSFNLAGEPNVLSPRDAIGTFFRSGIDYLVLGDYLVWK